MHAPRASPATLLAAAFISIALLAALSDFDPKEVAGLESMGEDPATLSVMVLGCRNCTGGYLLELSDGMGGEATAFCPAGLLGGPLYSGAVVTVTVQRSSDDPDFLYVRAISAPGGTGKD